MTWPGNHQQRRIHINNTFFLLHHARLSEGNAYSAFICALHTIHVVLLVIIPFEAESVNKLALYQKRERGGFLHTLPACLPPPRIGINTIVKSSAAQLCDTFIRFHRVEVSAAVRHHLDPCLEKESAHALCRQRHALRRDGTRQEVLQISETDLSRHCGYFFLDLLPAVYYSIQQRMH